MKVIIEDLVAKHSGKKEKELPENTTIRFEFDNGESLSVNIKYNAIHIYKRSSGIEQIEIHPSGSNRIYVK